MTPTIRLVIIIDSRNYFGPVSRGANLRNIVISVSVCMSACLFVCLSARISKKTRAPEFTEFIFFRFWAVR